MGHHVLVNKDNVDVGGTVYDTGAVVTVSDTQFTSLTDAGAFAGGSPTLTDQGAVSDNPSDAVYVSTAAPTLTSAAAATNPPTKVEFDKVVVDIAALRTALTGSVGSGKPLHT